MPEASQVERMFAGIASRYDRANHLLSGGFDFSWRRKLALEVRSCDHETVVDLATGSGDVAFALARQLDARVRITGIDFCRPMLERASGFSSQVCRMTKRWAGLPSMSRTIGGELRMQWRWKL